MTILSVINWEMWGAIANFVMAVAAFVTIIVTLWIRHSESRARLTVSIVEIQGLFLLKMSNIGKSAAYDIHLHVKGEPIERNPLSFVKDTFNLLLNQKFSLEPNRDVFYLLMPIRTYGLTRFLKHGEKLESQIINNWIEQYQDCPLDVNIKYNGKYSFHDSFVIRDFLVSGSIQFDEDVVGALHEIRNVIEHLKFDRHGYLGNLWRSGKNTMEVLK